MPPRLKRTTCWRNRSPHLDNFSAPCRLAENAAAAAAATDEITAKMKFRRFKAMI
jgi:hypothetical protein